MDEFEVLRQELAAYLAPAAELLLVPLLHRELPERAGAELDDCG